MKTLKSFVMNKRILSLLVFLSVMGSIQAQTLDSIPPDTAGIRTLTSAELSKEMGCGWNVGNSLDAIGGETAWGNPMITKRLIDSVKAAGFKVVRIPVAWSKFTNPTTFTIDTILYETGRSSGQLCCGKWNVCDAKYTLGWRMDTTNLCQTGLREQSSGCDVEADCHTLP